MKLSKSTENFKMHSPLETVKFKNANGDTWIVNRQEQTLEEANATMQRLINSGFEVEK